jgi:hypothetical protein
VNVKTEKFEKYAIVEMMGHRKIAGLVQDSEIGGSTLLRVDILNAEGGFDRTEYIGVGSIYCLTIVEKEVAEAVARNYTPKPSFAYDLRAVTSFALPAHLEDDEDEDEDDDYEDVEEDY